ncbi:MAG: mutT/nudix family protein [Alphaproteobacteria bacterium]|nr:mutT/nudix family protein [Alphaproteobacteria bacterium]
MNRSDIKIKAYAVFRRGSQILVNEVRETEGTLIGFRVPGGHVEFGEKAFDAVQREIMEELSVEAENYKLLPVMENTFHYAGEEHHEIIFAYTTNFKNKSLYEQETIQAFEHTNNKSFTLFWLDPEKCPPGTRIFPTGLVELLR